MKSNQRFIIDTQFFKDLEDFTYEKSKNGFAQRTNYQLFIEAILKPDIQIKFNCNEDVFYKLAEESEIISWLMESESETEQTRIYLSPNSNEMIFLESDEYAPNDLMLNHIYLKKFSEEEKRRCDLYGILALSPDNLMRSSSLFSNNGDAMKKDSNAKWSFKEYNKNCNALIIADLYILTRNKKDNLYPILDGLLPKQYTEDFQLTIFTKPVTNTRINTWDSTSIYNYRKEAREYLKEQWIEINEWLNNNRDYSISLVLFSCKNEDIHNRHIVTNYHLIDCGAGFDQVNKRDNSNLTRKGNVITLRASNQTFEKATATHTTTYNIYFPLFSLARNEVILKDYLNTIDEVKKVIENKSIRVDKYTINKKETPQDDLNFINTNRLFSIITLKNP